MYCYCSALFPKPSRAFLSAVQQLVFCFAEASAITRPSHATLSSSTALLSPMAHMACVGSLLSGPMLVAGLGGSYPALYPSVDMFLAPFLAGIAADVDEVLASLPAAGEDRDDAPAFLATFVALNALGMLISGLFCVLADRVKLANLAGFLPYPVLAGFFGAVGISLWGSAFKVDAGVAATAALRAAAAPGAAGALGRAALAGGLARHAPSLVAGAALHVVRSRGNHFLPWVIGLTVAVAYLVMFLTGTSLGEARGMALFWDRAEVTKPAAAARGGYAPPLPFGLWFPAVLGSICWPAFRHALSNVLAMSVIFLLRCSLHAGECCAVFSCSFCNQAHRGLQMNAQRALGL